MRHLTLFIICLFALAACDSPAEDTAGAESETEEVAATEEAEEEEAHDHHDETGHEMADDMEPGETRHFGAPFAIEDDPIELHELLAQAGDDEDFESSEPVKVSAEVHQVCQTRGCWFTLSTDAVEIPVRVRMADYEFFVARNTDGAAAIVEGTLVRTTISEDMAQHYAEDLASESGEEPEQIEGPQDTFEFTATAISMTLPES